MDKLIGFLSSKRGRASAWTAFVLGVLSILPPFTSWLSKVLFDGAVLWMHQPTVGMIVFMTVSAALFAYAWFVFCLWAIRKLGWGWLTEKPFAWAAMTVLVLLLLEWISFWAFVIPDARPSRLLYQIWSSFTAISVVPALALIAPWAWVCEHVRFAHDRVTQDSIMIRGVIVHAVTVGPMLWGLAISLVTFIVKKIKSRKKG